MANIAFIKTPSALSLAGNKVLFTIAGKNAFSNADVKAINKLYITGQHYHVVEGSVAPDDIPYLPDGTIRDNYNWYNVVNVGYMQFTWGINKVFLYCYDVTLNPIYNYPTGVPGGGDLYLQELAAWFIQNPALNNDFLIEYNQADGCIDFTARKFGTQYNLTLATTNPANIDIDISGDISKPNNNYSLGIRPEDSDSNEIVLIERPIKKYALEDGELPQDFDSGKAGVTTVDVSGILQEEITGHLSFPTPKNYGAFHALVKSIKIFAFEKFGSPPLAQGGAYSNLFYYLQGKLSNFAQGELNYLGKTFEDRIRENGIFLTNAPVEKTTDIYAPERLYFLFLVAGTYKMGVKQYYSDGTTAITLKESYYVQQYQVRELFCSYDKIRTNAPKKLVKYEVYLTDADNNTVTEIRTFIIDYTYYGYARYFYFLNRFNAYECMRTTGMVSKSRDVTKEFVKIDLPNGFISTDKEEKQISEDLEIPYVINAGYFTNKYWADYFQEFLLAREVYWLKRGKAYPVSVQKNKQEIYKDGNYNPEADFTITHGLHDDFTEEYTAQEPIVVGDFNIDFNTDYFTGETQNLWEVILDELFDNWNAGLPVNWTKSGDGVISNDNNRCKIISATGATTAILYNTSFMTKVLYKLSFTVDYISPNSLLMLRAAGYTSPAITAAGDYSFQFSFNNIQAINHNFTAQFAAFPGNTNVNTIISNIKLEYEYTELENTLLDDNFDFWEPESSIPLPLGWTAYGAWSITNFISNDLGRFKITLASNAVGYYNLSHNFKFEAGQQYKFTISIAEITNSQIRLYVGNSNIATFPAVDIVEANFNPILDFYGFDLRFELLPGARTVLIDNFTLEKL